MLENYQMSLIMSEGSTLTIDNLPHELRVQKKEYYLSNLLEEKEISFKDNKKSMIKDYEIKTIIEALEKSNWNKSKAAKRLGISRRSLLYKIKKYEIKRK